MPLDHNAKPGSGVGNFSFIPVVTRGSGPIDMPTAAVSDTNKVTPLKSFSYTTLGGPIAFYKGMPRIVTPAIKTALLAAGLVS